MKKTGALIIIVLGFTCSIIAQSIEATELRRKIKEAVAQEDYGRAEELKEQLNLVSGNKDKKLALEKELKKAINREDYGAAKKLKNEIEFLTNGNSIASSNIKIIPELVNNVYAFKDDKLVALESHLGEISILEPLKATAVYLTTISYNIPGNNSNTLLPASSSFCVKVAETKDTTNQFTLIKLEQNDNNRYTPYYNSKRTKYSGDSWTLLNEVKTKFQPIGETLFKITPASSLDAGEYAFLYINKFYCFRVE